MSTKTDAYLDGLVFARDILWSLGLNDYLKLIGHRLKDRYDIGLWAIRSPVEGDNATTATRGCNDSTQTR
jgi:hypothetical protein